MNERKNKAKTKLSQSEGEKTRRKGLRNILNVVCVEKNRLFGDVILTSPKKFKNLIFATKYDGIQFEHSIDLFSFDVC